MACCSIVSMHEARRNVGMSLFEQRAGRIASVEQVLMVLLWVWWKEDVSIYNFVHGT